MTTARSLWPEVVIAIYNRRMEPSVVTALRVSRHLALHRALAHDGKGWMVSHIATGMAVYEVPIKRKRSAAKAARAIAALGCWGFIHRNARPGAEIKLKVYAIADACR